MHGVLQGVEDTGTDVLVQKINLMWKGVVGLRYQRGCSLHARKWKNGLYKCRTKGNRKLRVRVLVWSQQSVLVCLKTLDSKMQDLLHKQLSHLMQKR